MSSSKWEGHLPGKNPALAKVGFTPSLLPTPLSFLICKTRGCGLVFKVVSKLCFLEPRGSAPEATLWGARETPRLPTPPSHSPFISCRGSVQGTCEGNEKGFCYENMVWENYGPKDIAKLSSRPVPGAL